MPSESDRAFEALRVYLELGPTRRYSDVTRKLGISLRTVKRWATDFDWRGRIKACSAQSAEDYTEAEAGHRRADLRDMVERTKALRERQFAMAEALLDAAETYLENIAGHDFDQINFSDACKALQVAALFTNDVAKAATEAPDDSKATLRDQLTALLNQAYAEKPAPTA